MRAGRAEEGRARAHFIALKRSVGVEEVKGEEEVFDSIHLSNLPVT